MDDQRIVELNPGMSRKGPIGAGCPETEPGSDAAPSQHRLGGQCSWQADGLYPGLGANFVDRPANGLDVVWWDKAIWAARRPACPGNNPLGTQQAHGETRQDQGTRGFDQGITTSHMWLHGSLSPDTILASPRPTRSLRKSRTSRWQVSASI